MNWRQSTLIHGVNQAKRVLPSISMELMDSNSIQTYKILTDYGCGLTISAETVTSTILAVTLINMMD